MQIDAYMKDWGITRKEPSDIFETVQVGMEGLMLKMNEKIGILTNEMRQPANIFKLWLSGISPRTSAVILQCGELMHLEPLPLRTILVTQNWTDSSELAISLEKTDMPLVESQVCSIEQLARATYKPYQRNDGRLLRSLLSGELLVLWNGDCRYLEGTVAGARTIFSKKPGADLAELLTRDLKGMGLDEQDLGKGKEFESIAKKAMKMRRVRPDKQGSMIRELKKAVAH